MDVGCTSPVKGVPTTIPSVGLSARRLVGEEDPLELKSDIWFYRVCVVCVCVCVGVCLGGRGRERENKNLTRLEKERVYRKERLGKALCCLSSSLAWASGQSGHGCLCKAREGEVARKHIKTGSSSRAQFRSLLNKHNQLTNMQGNAEAQPETAALGALSLGFYTDESVKRLSCCSVTQSESFDTLGNAVTGGLCVLAMGNGLVRGIFRR